MNLEQKIEKAFQGLHFTDKLRTLIGDNMMDIFVLRVGEIISERDKEWCKNIELATTAISEDGKVRFVRIDEPDFTKKLQTIIK